MVRFFIGLIFSLTFFLQPCFSQELQSNVDVEWRDLAGFHKVSDFKGSPLILHFWASWCVACKIEALEIANFVNYDLGDAKFIAVSIGSDFSRERASMRSMSKSEKVHVAVVDRIWLGRLFLRSIPSTIIFNRDGRVVARYTGSTPWSNYALFKAIKHL